MLFNLCCKMASLVAQMAKNLPAIRETWVPFLGWEDPLEKGTAIHYSILWRRKCPLQYSCLKNSMDRETWWAIVHGVAKSQTLLNDFTLTHSIPVWRIPWTEEPSRLQSVGLQSVRHDWATFTFTLRRPEYRPRKKRWGKLFENKKLAFLMAGNVSIPGWKPDF